MKTVSDVYLQKIDTACKALVAIQEMATFRAASKDEFTTSQRVLADVFAGLNAATEIYQQYEALALIQRTELAPLQDELSEYKDRLDYYEKVSEVNKAQNAYLQTELNKALIQEDVFKEAPSLREKILKEELMWYRDDVKMAKASASKFALLFCASLSINVMLFVVYSL